MLLPTILVIYIWILQLGLPSVYGKCCQFVLLSDEGCGDSTPDTPCCGYGKCNGFCCACKGSEYSLLHILQTSLTQKFFVATVVSSTKVYCGQTKTTYVTAPPGTTWTCRDVHTSTPWATFTCAPGRRDVLATAIGDSELDDSLATSTRMSRPTSLPTFTPPHYDPQALKDLKARFDHVSGGKTHNGVEAVTLDDYFSFFNITNDQQESPLAKNVAAKFQAHDVNGDGVLTFNEVQLVCDETGCD
ncbi:hypothetical protein H2200_007664 [Cladophialophora chaetospira]|uniref:EF-hand domain-containing protein n=1 Tax=Cladophialophora chaetospira TaxID=386627 RepID=A0AA39CGA9_9EURO|nr:hypothetical protein H2200_007664 [Cladophialophora chaetospira]